MSSSATDRILCANNAIIPGPRSALDDWPFFPSQPSLSTESILVSPLALSFRRAAYEYARIPSFLNNFVYNSKVSKSDIPRMQIMYAKRGGRWQGRRTLTSGDEIWLNNTLHSQGMEVKTVIVNDYKSITFAEQVRAFQNSGMVVGVHGANLVNAMFVPPFGALVEIVPRGGDGDVQWRRCYEGGMNSGLRHWRVLAGEYATNGIERMSGGQEWVKSGEVRVSEGLDRIKVENAIKEASEYIKYVNNAFKKLQHVPLVWNAQKKVYGVRSRKKD